MDKARAHELVQQMANLAGRKSGFEDHDRQFAYQYGYLMGFIVRMMMDDSAVIHRVKATIEHLNNSAKKTR